VLGDLRVDRGALARLPFRKGSRGAIVVPEGLEVAGPEDDDRNEGRLRLALAFALRPGSYATMLVKRCTYDVGGSSVNRPPR
jgi:tRNA(Glu) U13 pseudouridine synthase TruD